MDHNRPKHLLRTLSALLTLVLFFSTVGGAVTVSADNAHTHDGVTFQEWTSTNSLPSSAGSYYLTSDVTISSTWNVPSGTVNLCLNDQKITYSGSSGSVIKISSGATLKLYDCGTTVRYYYIGATSTYNSSCLGAIVSSTSDSNYVNATRRGSFTGGYITGGYGTYYSGSTVFGGGVFVDGGSFVLNGGCIFGNRLSVRDGGNGGGGIAVRQTSSSFVMNGGYVIGNHAGRFGGGIRIDGGTFTMNGGEVRHNTANTPNSGGAGCGGGIHMGGLDGGATVTIAGGVIEGNYAGLKDGKGGGICAAGGSLTITGGTITGNNATLSGGGISGTFSVSGNPTITGNTVGGTFVADSYTLTGGTKSNVHLGSNQTITLTGALTTGASIGVTMEAGSGTFTSNWSTKMSSEAKPSDYFTTDASGYSVVLSNGEAEIGTAPHEHDGLTFTKWTSTNSLPTAAGNYYLASDVTISSTWEVPAGTTSLCLNGHGIKRTGTGTVIKVGEGNTFKLYECDDATEHKYSVASPASNGAGVATVNDSLTSNYQTFKGGYITGGYNGGGYQYGAGVNVEGNGATFYMYGGTIIGNRLTAGSTGGGGVCLQDWDSSGGFYMYGGAIIGNTSNYGGGLYVRTGTAVIQGGIIEKNVANGNIGGGVLVFGGSSTLIVKDGSISNNSAVHGGAMEASGDGTITIEGGSFLNNLASGKGGALTNQRTDGDTSPATFNISGTPVFSGNTASGNANDVYLCNTAVLNLTGAMTNTTKILVTRSSTTGTFTSNWSTYMTAGQGNVADPSDYFTTSASGCSVVLNDGEAAIKSHEHDGTVFEKWTATDSLPTSGNYYLTADVTVTGTTTVSGTLHLCLNGHSITHTGTSGAIFTVNGDGKNLYLYDCDDTVHYYYIDSTTNLGVVVATAAEAQAGNATKNGSFTGGYLTGGKGYPVNPVVGGAVYAGSGGTFTLNGGTLIGNTAPFGGAVQVRNASSFTMTGGAIIGNDATGGAINADGNSSNKSSVAIYGGTITHNVSGIRIGATGSQFLALSGSIEIYNNDTYDLYISDNLKIRIDGAIANTHKMVVKDPNQPRTITSGWSTYMSDGQGGTLDPADYFSSLDEAYEILLSNNEAITSIIHYHVWGYEADGNVITATCSGPGTCDLTSQTVTITADGKDYDGTAVTATVEKSENWDEYGLTEPGEIVYSEDTNAGTHTASVTVGEVTASVEFTIAPIDATVTITGHTGKADYDGEKHTVTGYDVTCDNELYDVTKDFIFTGSARVSRTNAGKSFMGLTEDMFSNTNKNFANVTFVITDGYSVVEPVDAVITTAPQAAEVMYNEEAQELVIAGEAEGGEVLYALGTMDEAPEEDAFEATIPTAIETGHYYVWYRVAADENHIDLEPVCVEVILTGRTESSVEINTGDSSEDFRVEINGLEEEARVIRKSGEAAIDENVSVVMTVVQKEEEVVVSDAELIKIAAEDQILEFFEVTVEKTVGSTTTVMDETVTVLEIVVPYAKADKKGVTVYSCHDGEVLTFEESDSKESGTFRVDAENGLVYIYSNVFSTYAIGYTPYYRVSGKITLGSFEGPATVLLENLDDESTFTLETDENGEVSFEGLPQGTYRMTVTWEDGLEFSISTTILIDAEEIPAEEDVKTSDAGPAPIEEQPYEPAPVLALATTKEDPKNKINKIGRSKQ